MSDTLQHVLVWLVVAVTLGAFGLNLWRMRRRRKAGGGCGGGCGCAKAATTPEQRVEQWQDSLR